MHDQEVIEMTSSIRASSRASCLAPHDPYPDDVSESGPGYQPLKHASQRSTTTTLDAFWIMEIAGVIVSIACLTAIVVIFHIHDGQPFSSWTFYLSLNAVVSILATTSKTTILVAVTAAISQGKWNVFKAGPHPLKMFQDIDQASRGGMGSLRAVWSSDIGSTVFFGALISTASIVFQPMTQATISNHGIFENDTLQASVGSTSNLSGGSFYVTGSISIGDGNGNGFSEYSYEDGALADTGLQTAIIGGFSTSENTDTSTQLAWICPTGNCTWPVYASLAVCGRCYDVSSLLTSQSLNDSMPMAYRDHSGYIISSPAGTNLTQYTLPYANLTIDNWDGYRNVLPEGNFPTATTYMVAKSEKFPNNTVEFQDYESLLISFSTIKADTAYMNNRSMWQDVRPVAMECGLFLCLQAYHTAVVSGEFAETVIATTKRQTSQSWRPMEGPGITKLNTLTWNPINNINNNNEGPSRTDFQLDALSLNTSISGPNATYHATQTLLVSMVDYFDGLLKPEGNLSLLDVDYAVVYDGMTDGRKYSSPTVKTFFQSSDLNNMFISVANSMTSYFRNTGDRAQKGSVRRWTIYYRIRWPFIALPVFGVLGGAILLMISIFQTHRQGMAVWKDNIIAAMVYSVNPGTRSRLRQMLRYQKLEDVGDLVVHMHELEDGVELSTMPPSEAMDDEEVDRTSMTSSRRVSDEDSLVPSASQIDFGDGDFANSKALVMPIPTRMTSDTPH